MNVKRAKKLEDVYLTCKGQPLTIDELDQFYKDTDEVRGGGSVRARIARHLRTASANNINHQVLFTGYKGSGKSTELNHLQRDLEKDFFVVNYSIQDQLDPVHITYIELFIVTMERLFSLANDHELPVSEVYLEQVKNWIATKEISDIRDKYVGVEAEAGTETKIGIPYLQTFFAKLTASAKVSRSLKEELKRNVEPRLSELIDHCNRLIQEVRLAAAGKEKTDLLIIIEDLDKIPYDRAQSLFFDHINQLTQLKAHVIFTFPVSVYYNVRFNNVRNYFTQVIDLPMIKVRQRNGQVYTDGVALMQSIIEARVEPKLFDDSLHASLGNRSVLEEMIDKSGGCLRDLLLMVKEAADAALDRGRSRIGIEDYKAAYQRLRKDYEHTVADNEKITAAQYYSVLQELADSNTKQIDNSEAALHLRQNLCILSYNGEGWHDVHPIMRDILNSRRNS